LGPDSVVFLLDDDVAELVRQDLPRAVDVGGKRGLQSHRDLSDSGADLVRAGDGACRNRGPRGGQGGKFGLRGDEAGP